MDLIVVVLLFFWGGGVNIALTFEDILQCCLLIAIVLPHWNATLQTQDMIPHPVCLKCYEPTCILYTSSSMKDICIKKAESHKNINKLFIYLKYIADKSI